MNALQDIVLERQGPELVEPCPVCEHCSICGSAPCTTPGFCRMCREVDRKAAERRCRPVNNRRPTPKTVIEAIMRCVRSRGLGALKEPGESQLAPHMRRERARRDQRTHRQAIPTGNFEMSPARNYTSEALGDYHGAGIPDDDAPPVNGPEDYGFANGRPTVIPTATHRQRTTTQAPPGIIPISLYWMIAEVNCRCSRSMFFHLHVRDGRQTRLTAPAPPFLIMFSSRFSASVQVWLERRGVYGHQRRGRNRLRRGPPLSAIAAPAKRPASRSASVRWRGSRPIASIVSANYAARTRARSKAPRPPRSKWQKKVEEAVEAGQKAPDMPAEAEVPDPFEAPRLFVSSATIEKLTKLLLARPQGMLHIGDELAGLFLNMSRYSGGSDREFWLEAWNGNSYRVERVNRPPVDVEHLLVGITGGFSCTSCPARLTVMPTDYPRVSSSRANRCTRSAAHRHRCRDRAGIRTRSPS